MCFMYSKELLHGGTRVMNSNFSFQTKFRVSPNKMEMSAARNMHCPLSISNKRIQEPADLVTHT